MNKVIIPEPAVFTGRKIERLRTLVGLSQTEFGHRIGGISKQAVSKLGAVPKNQ